MDQHSDQLFGYRMYIIRTRFIFSLLLQHQVKLLKLVWYANYYGTNAYQVKQAKTCVYAVEAFQVHLSQKDVSDGSSSRNKRSNVASQSCGA